jgi:Bacterial antitoxin of type II TA system, VapB
MRTTVDLPDELVLEVQRLAREQNRTMRSVMEEALRATIARYQRAQVFELPDASVDGNGLRPDLGDAGWDELRALAYGNRL